MTINTKFAVGDEGFFLSENKVKTATVTEIRILVERDGPRDSNPRPQITYCIDDTFSIQEKELFRSKEELLKSL